MGVISNMTEEIDTMRYEEVVHKLVVDVIQKAEDDIAKELEREYKTKEIAKMLLDDLIRDAITKKENKGKENLRKTRLLTNGSLKHNKSDTSLLMPIQRNCVTIGIGSIAQPAFSKSTLIATYAIKGQDKRSIPASLAATVEAQYGVRLADVVKVEMKKEVDEDVIVEKCGKDKKCQRVGDTILKKSLPTRLRKFFTRLFGCCLPQNTD